MVKYIYEHKNWTDFTWQEKAINAVFDKVLAEYYGFTEEELDFIIISYDIKYRVEKALESDE